MKKYLTNLIIFLPFALIAQIPGRPQEGISITRSPNSTSIGIISGLNFSQTLLKNFEVADPEIPITGFSGGIKLRQQISERWSVNINLLYEEKGYKRNFYRINHEGEKVGEPLSIDFRFHYLTIPLYVNFQTTGKIKYNIGGGIYSGYLLNAFLFEPYFEQNNWQLPPWEWEVIGILKRNQTEHFHRLDFGMTVQTGINTQLTEYVSAGLNLNFDHGLISINKPETFGDIKYINRNMGIRVNMNYNF